MPGAGLKCAVVRAPFVHLLTHAYCVYLEDVFFSKGQVIHGITSALLRRFALRILVWRVRHWHLLHNYTWTPRPWPALANGPKDCIFNLYRTIVVDSIRCKFVVFLETSPVMASMQGRSGYRSLKHSLHITLIRAACKEHPALDAQPWRRCGVIAAAFRLPRSDGSEVSHEPGLVAGSAHDYIFCRVP